MRNIESLELDMSGTQGDDWTLRFRAKVNGVPVADFTGWTFRAEVFNRRKVKIATFEFNLEEGEGWVNAIVPRTQTASPSLVASDNLWELEYDRPVSGGFRRRTSVTGRFPVSRGLVAPSE